MDKKTIWAPKDAIFLSQFMKELPEGIFNKKSTGCGASSLALEDKNPTILVSPIKELIDNKVAQYPNERCKYKLLAVYAGVTDSEISDYLDTEPVPKILVTYDSFKRLSLFVNPSDYRIVVDEYQELLKAYSFRDKAIDSLFKALKEFNYVTYLSATPIAPEYTPVELEMLPYTEIVWENTISIKPIRFKTNKPYNAVVNIINRYKAGEVPEINGIKSDEAFFFVNSVRAIVDIIENAGLKQSEVKIVCSNNPDNRKKLGDFEINKALDPNKPFTFITSTAFVGCDFKSSTGVVFVVSNCNSKTTLLDVSTDIYQIAGRIRNLDNPFKNILYHIYNTNTAETTEEEFNEAIRIKINETNSLIKGWSNLETDARNWVKKRISEKSEDDYAFYDEIKNCLVFNDLKIKSEQFRYNIIHNLYKNGISIREAYLKAGFDVSEAQQYEHFTDKFIMKATKKISFTELCMEYVTNYEEEQDHYNNFFRLEEIAKEFPIIPQAITVLGVAKIKALGYQHSKIKNELLVTSPEAKNAVYYELKKEFLPGDKWSNTDIKARIQAIYNKLEMKKTAKATDLKEYFDVKPTQIPVNGIRKNGLEIMSMK